MAKAYTIVTDITCDLPKRYYEENDVAWVKHGLIIEGEEYWDEFGSVITNQAVMAKSREKKAISTLQVQLADFEQHFTKAAENGLDVLYVGFSSGLSGTYSTSCIAADMVREKYPECEIYCVDSLGATMGNGIQTMEAVRLRNAGKSAREAAEILEKKRLQACHFFTVDDLFHLFRGGRLSRTSAAVGSLMGIKPVMYVSDEGKLTPLSKVRGRKASMLELAKLTAQYIADKTQTIYITHGDVEDEAHELGGYIQELLPEVGINIAQLSPVIAAHSGPGTLALFFWGEKRL